MRRFMKVVDFVLSQFENWTIFFAVMAGLVSLMANIILRYGFNYTLAWSEELIRHIITYTTLIGCSAAIKSRTMITIDALPQLVPVLRKPILFISHLATLAFAVVITYLGWAAMMEQKKSGMDTILLLIPWWILYAMIPLMGAMMFIRTIMNVADDVQTQLLAREEGS